MQAPSGMAALSLVVAPDPHGALARAVRPSQLAALCCAHNRHGEAEPGRTPNPFAFRATHLRERRR